MNGEKLRIRDEAVVTDLKMLFRHLIGKIALSEYLVIRPRFEPGSCQ
jgi:hypothetical protein